MAADSSYNGVLKPVVASRQFKDFMEAVEKHLAERKAAAAKGKGWLHASMCFDAAREGNEWPETQRRELQKRIYAALSATRSEELWPTHGKQCLILAQRMASFQKKQLEKCAIIVVELSRDLVKAAMEENTAAEMRVVALKHINIIRLSVMAGDMPNQLTEEDVKQATRASPQVGKDLEAARAELANLAKHAQNLKRAGEIMCLICDMFVTKSPAVAKVTDAFIALDAVASSLIAVAADKSMAEAALHQFRQWFSVAKVAVPEYIANVKVICEHLSVAMEAATKGKDTKIDRDAFELVHHSAAKLAAWCENTAECRTQLGLAQDVLDLCAHRTLSQSLPNMLKLSQTDRTSLRKQVGTVQALMGRTHTDEVATRTRLNSMGPGLGSHACILLASPLQSDDYRHNSI